MRDIHCPKDIGFENTFSGEDCEKEQYYNNCYHCWSTAKVKALQELRDNSEIKNEVKDLSKRVETLEKQLKEEKEEKIEKLKAEIDYAKFRCALPTISDMMSNN